MRKLSIQKQASLSVNLISLSTHTGKFTCQSVGRNQLIFAIIHVKNVGSTMTSDEASEKFRFNLHFLNIKMKIALRRLCFHHRNLMLLNFLTLLFANVVFIQVYFSSLVQIYFVNELSNVAMVLPFKDGFGAMVTSSKHGEMESTLDVTNAHRKGFGACILVKDDNDLLYEWIAYHYTVLPLRYLVVGSDINSTQDPATVLNRWTQANITDLHFTILQPKDFIYRHADCSNNSGLTKEILIHEYSAEWKMHHHHLLVDRQKAFVTTCTEILQKAGMDWTLYIDTDEFVVWNPWTNDDDRNNFTVDGSGSDSISSKSLQMRKTFANRRSVSDTKQYYSLIRHLQNKGDISECYTLPRLLVGALENRTCPVQYEVQDAQQLGRANLHERFEHMSTLRFFQHAKKGDFSRSKYGKVMMDLSKISDETIRVELPRSIHRPYISHCGPAGSVNFPNTLFYLLHYVGSWERYSARNDHRRDRRVWESRAFVDDDMSACSSMVFNWYLQFYRHVGEERTRFLLGSVADI
jgi:hypothetical protein